MGRVRRNVHDTRQARDHRAIADNLHARRGVLRHGCHPRPKHISVHGRQHMDTAADGNEHLPADGYGRRDADGDFQAARCGSRQGFWRKGRRRYRRFGRFRGGTGLRRRGGPGRRRHIRRQQLDHSGQRPEDLLWSRDSHGGWSPFFGFSHRPDGNGKDRMRGCGSDHLDAEKRRESGCRFADELRSADRHEQYVWAVSGRNPGLHDRRQQGQPNRGQLRHPVVWPRPGDDGRVRAECVFGRDLHRVGPGFHLCHALLGPGGLFHRDPVGFQ